MVMLYPKQPIHNLIFRASSLTLCKGEIALWILEVCGTIHNWCNIEKRYEN